MVLLSDVGFAPEPSVTFSSGQSSASPPDVRILHYNDVYHLDPSSAEPVGGIARFITVCKEYKEHDKYQGQPALVTLFSGDVFSPASPKVHPKQFQTQLLPSTYVADTSYQAVTWFPS
jgi:hypothetical protein